MAQCEHFPNDICCLHYVPIGSELHGSRTDKKIHLLAEDGFRMNRVFSSAAWRSLVQGPMALRPRIATGLLLSENPLVFSYTELTQSQNACQSIFNPGAADPDRQQKAEPLFKDLAMPAAEGLFASAISLR